MRSRAASPTSLPTTSGSTTSTRRAAAPRSSGPIERYNELTGEDGRGRARARGRGPRSSRGGRGRRRASRPRGCRERRRSRIEAPVPAARASSGCGRSSANGARPFSASQRSGSWAGRSRSCERHLERALGSLQPAEQDVAATMFDHLVTPSGSKIAHRPRDLAQYAEVGESEVMPVLDALGRERIVRAVDGAGGGERYEIFHDVLADGVLAWRARRVIERDREEAHAAAAPPRRTRGSCARRAGCDDRGRRLRPDGTLTCAQCGSPGAGTCPRGEVPLRAGDQPGACARGCGRRCPKRSGGSRGRSAPPGARDEPRAPRASCARRRCRWWPLRPRAAGCSPGTQSGGLRVYSTDGTLGADLAGPSPCHGGVLLA